MLCSLAFLFILNNYFFYTVWSGQGEILEFVCSKLSSSECLLPVLVKALDDMLDKLMIFSVFFRVVLKRLKSKQTQQFVETRFL